MLVVLLSILIVGSSGNINPHGPTVVNDYANCINKIIEINFSESGLLYFVNTMNMSTSVARIRADILKAVHRDRDKIYVQIASPTRIDKPMCKGILEDANGRLVTTDRFVVIPLANYVIAIIDTYDDFAYVASRLIRARSWNPKARFVIILFHFAVSDTINREYAENIVQCLYDWNVINIVVIVPQADNIRNALIYGWKPYDPPKYCGYRNETVSNRLFIENVCERGNLKYKNKNLFYNKIPHEMNNCILDILALERQPFVSSNTGDPNIEISFVNSLISEYGLKSHYNLLYKPRGEKIGDEWAGALRDLVAKKGQILLGGIFPDDEVHRDFEFSSTYLSDSFTWVVPRAFHIHPWTAPVIVFTDTVWYCTIAGFLLCVISWRLFGKLSVDSSYHNNLGHCFMNTLVSNLGFAAYSRPVKGSLRMFFVFFNLYCILFVTGYQTKLIDVLTSPPFMYQMKTVEELVESGLKFGGPEELHDLFYNSSDSLDNFIGEQWIDVDNVYEAMTDVTVHRNFSLLCSRLELALISASLPELSDNFGNLKYYAFEKNVFTVPMEMVSLKGFPFMMKFSRKILLYSQIGFDERLRRFFAAQMLRRKAELLDNLDHVSKTPALSLEHLEGGFFALFLGYLSGTFVLFVEIFVNSDYVKTKTEYLKLLLRKRINRIRL